MVRLTSTGNRVKVKAPRSGSERLELVLDSTGRDGSATGGGQGGHWDERRQQQQEQEQRQVDEVRDYDGDYDGGINSYEGVGVQEQQVGHQPEYYIEDEQDYYHAAGYSHRALYPSTSGQSGHSASTAETDNRATSSSGPTELSRTWSLASDDNGNLRYVEKNVGNLSIEAVSSRGYGGDGKRGDSRIYRDDGCSDYYGSYSGAGGRTHFLQQQQQHDKTVMAQQLTHQYADPPASPHAAYYSQHRDEVDAGGRRSESHTLAAEATPRRRLHRKSVSFEELSLESDPDPTVMLQESRDSETDLRLGYSKTVSFDEMSFGSDAERAAKIQESFDSEVEAQPAKDADASRMQYLKPVSFDEMSFGSDVERSAKPQESFDSEAGLLSEDDARQADAQPQEAPAERQGKYRKSVSFDEASFESDTNPAGEEVGPLGGTRLQKTAVSHKNRNRRYTSLEEANPESVIDTAVKPQEGVNIEADTPSEAESQSPSEDTSAESVGWKVTTMWRRSSKENKPPSSSKKAEDKPPLPPKRAPAQGGKSPSPPPTQKIKGVLREKPRYSPKNDTAKKEVKNRLLGAPSKQERIIASPSSQESGMDDGVVGSSDKGSRDTDGDGDDSPERCSVATENATSPANAKNSNTSRGNIGQARGILQSWRQASNTQQQQQGQQQQQQQQQKKKQQHQHQQIQQQRQQHQQQQQQQQQQRQQQQQQQQLLRQQHQQNQQIYQQQQQQQQQLQQERPAVRTEVQGRAGLMQTPTGSSNAAVGPSLNIAMGSPTELNSHQHPQPRQLLPQVKLNNRGSTPSSLHHGAESPAASALSNVAVALSPASNGNRQLQQQQLHQYQQNSSDETAFHHKRTLPRDHPAYDKAQRQHPDSPTLQQQYSNVSEATSAKSNAALDGYVEPDDEPRKNKKSEGLLKRAKKIKNVRNFLRRKAAGSPVKVLKNVSQGEQEKDSDGTPRKKQQDTSRGTQPQPVTNYQFEGYDHLKSPQQASTPPQSEEYYHTFEEWPQLSAGQNIRSETNDVNKDSHNQWEGGMCRAGDGRGSGMKDRDKPWSSPTGDNTAVNQAAVNTAQGNTNSWVGIEKPGLLAVQNYELQLNNQDEDSWSQWEGRDRSGRAAEDSPWVSADKDNTTVNQTATFTSNDNTNPWAGMGRPQKKDSTNKATQTHSIPNSIITKRTVNDNGVPLATPPSGQFDLSGKGTPSVKWWTWSQPAAGNSDGTSDGVDKEERGTGDWTYVAFMCMFPPAAVG